jgi:hypothetical protein
MFTLADFRKDFCATSDQDIITAMKSIITLPLLSKPFTFQEIYHDTQLGDIHLYLALHFLISLGEVKGVDPYGPAFDHNETYSLT